MANSLGGVFPDKEVEASSKTTPYKGFKIDYKNRCAEINVRGKTLVVRFTEQIPEENMKAYLDRFDEEIINKIFVIADNLGFGKEKTSKGNKYTLLNQIVFSIESNGSISIGKKYKGKEKKNIKDIDAHYQAKLDKLDQTAANYQEKLQKIKKKRQEMKKLHAIAATLFSPLSKN